MNTESRSPSSYAPEKGLKSSTTALGKCIVCKSRDASRNLIDITQFLALPAKCKQMQATHEKGDMIKNLFQFHVDCDDDEGKKSVGMEFLKFVNTYPLYFLLVENNACQ